jgi:hypothetical protein
MLTIFYVSKSPDAAADLHLRTEIHLDLTRATHLRKALISSGQPRMGMCMRDCVPRRNFDKIEEN